MSSSEMQQPPKQMYPVIGEKAPYFKAKMLVNGEFKTMSLDDFKGKYVILFFYPMDFTFVCPTEILAFNDSADEFKAMGCEVIGASTDSVYCHLAWTEKPRNEGGLGDIKIPLIGDVSHEVSKAYNVLITSGENKGVPLRGTFIIDKNQILRVACYNDPPIGRSTIEFMRLLTAIQHFEENGEVCPVNWNKGDTTIKPHPEASKEFFKAVNK